MHSGGILEQRRGLPARNGVVERGRIAIRESPSMRPRGPNACHGPYTQRPSSPHPLWKGLCKGQCAQGIPASVLLSYPSLPSNSAAHSTRRAEVPSCTASVLGRPLFESSQSEAPPCTPSL